MKDVATARVSLTVDVRVSGSWGEDCTIGQLRDQASEAARNVVKRALESNDGKVVGQVEVKSVIHIQPSR